MAALIYAIVVVLVLPGKNKELINYVKTVILKMTGNSWFTSPKPTLAEVDAALTAFADAETSMGIRKKVRGDRAKKKIALIALLNHLADYVRSICEANPDSAAAIAESAGMRLKRLTPRVKLPFNVTQGSVSGTVICDAKAAGMPATYYFAFSLDQKTWTSVPDAMTSKITIAGLTPGQTYYFRFRTLTRKGLSDFSQVVSLLVK